MQLPFSPTDRQSFNETKFRNTSTKGNINLRRQCNLVFIQGLATIGKETGCRAAFVQLTTKDALEKKDFNDIQEKIRSLELIQQIGTVRAVFKHLK